MLRKSKVLDDLKILCKHITLKDIEAGYDGVSAAVLAKRLQMDRANVSKELNVLYQDGEIVKVTGRPVYFFVRKQLEEILHRTIDVQDVHALKDYLDKKPISKKDDFDCIIGSNGSLQTVIKKAKAAMIYPPFGLHTLLVGPTGVGKTMFAEIMYHFAKSQGVLHENGDFVVFNCAEYADNPQLLLAQLFGYVKGAFTGAETDSKGLIANADGGILFLDEIHRLPPEGQEMLFMLLDKGVYRRIGDGSNTMQAQVLLIGATTENIESTMLNTFIRRIPMTIDIPSLHARPLKEKMDLISKFFKQEYNQVLIPITIKPRIMSALLCYNCTGNIGQLKADIRLICARGFLEYKTKNTDMIHIDTAILPDEVYNGLLNKDKLLEVEQLPEFRRDEDFIFDETTLLDELDHEVMEDVYEKINKQYERLVEKGYSQEKISGQIKNFIEEYIADLLHNIETDELPENDEIFKIMSPRVYKVVEIALQLAQQKLARKISKKAKVALAMHVSALLENNGRRSSLKENIHDVVLDHPNEYYVAKMMRSFLQSELDVTFHEQEAILFTMFLCMDEEEKRQNSESIGLLVLAHGDGIARNMVEVANTLMRSNHAHALDMSLKENVEVFLNRACDKVVEINEGKGVLLLVDMGSLLSFGEIIQQKTGILIKTIDMVSTPFVLEAYRKSMLSDNTLDIIYNELRTYVPYVGRMYSQDIKQQMCSDFAIITTCITGEGAAVKLGELLKKTVPLIEEHRIDIISCNAQSFKEKHIADKKIIACVGAIDLKLDGVTYVSSDKMILEDGLTIINQLIIKATGADSVMPIVPNFVVGNLLAETLIFLDPIKANEVITNSFKILEKMIEMNDYNRLLIGYILHMGSMIERIIQMQPLNYPNIAERIAKNEELYHAVQTAMHALYDGFNIQIPDTEIGFVMDIFDTV